MQTFRRGKGGIRVEYEVVSHQHLPGIRVFVVEIFSRTAHTHREFELCLLLRGGMQIDMAGGVAKLRPGEMALISPWQPHAFQAEAEGALLLILQASPQFCAGYFPQAAQLRFEGAVPLPAACAARLRLQLLELGRHCFSHPAGYEFLAMGAVNWLFGGLFASLRWHTEPQLVDRGASRVMRVAARMESDYAEPLRLKELAEAEGVSADYLSHAFRRYLGMTFQAYLSQVRLEHAAGLADRTQMSVTDICAACGYSSPRYLTADFRRKYGCTLAQWRARPERGPTQAQPPAPDTRQRFYYHEEALEALARFEMQSSPKIPHTGA